MYHKFIYSSVDGPLGCFHVLAIVKTAAMNIGIHSPAQKPRGRHLVLFSNKKCCVIRRPFEFLRLKDKQKK